MQDGAARPEGRNRPGLGNIRASVAGPADFATQSGAATIRAGGAGAPIRRFGPVKGARPKAMQIPENGAKLPAMAGNRAARPDLTADPPKKRRARRPCETPVAPP